ncbi:hypothetical protein A8V01_04445 [Novosphingobium guangzhouense]|uniref:Glycosyl transferase family 1 domain-containing protein n=2 Tax=Novosphingobium guangzhouense TaxID=1850347 RepID=A0A2K2G209_9SPHN|nr:hypothetical protein A8V01_04445 [Novosphingobium guangzhouense]
MVVASLAGERMYPKPRASTEGRPYFLCVGTIESRKNHALLVNIWRRLIERNGAQSPRLLIVGQWGVGSQRLRDMLISSPQLHGHVTVLDRCGDEEMGRLVKGARALLMPTLCEGFGLPMVEAIQLGTPVIATDLPCFREIGQGIPTLLPPSDEAAWEALIEHFGPEHPEHIRQLDRARQFRPTSWNDHFFKIEDWLPTLSERKHPLPERANHSDRLPMSANLPFLSIE